MIEFVKTWLALKTDRRAVTALEYGLIAGVIVATVAVGFNVLGGDLSDKFNEIANKVTTPTS
jgi:pilus assembly protein Flp/PilA